MVRAILDGRKTMTRRVITTKAFLEWIDAGFSDEFTKHPDNLWAESCPYGKPGDRLWVRETWQPEYVAGHEQDGPIRYRATHDERVMGHKWRPSIFMPRWASRITLEVISVREEPLQDITEGDARAEGVTMTTWHTLPDGDGESLAGVPHQTPACYRNGFANLWDSINGKKYPWVSNPFVWVIEFRRIEPSGITG